MPAYKFPLLHWWQTRRVLAHLLSPRTLTSQTPSSCGSPKQDTLCSLTLRLYVRVSSLNHLLLSTIPTLSTSYKTTTSSPIFPTTSASSLNCSLLFNILLTSTSSPHPLLRLLRPSSPFPPRRHRRLLTRSRLSIRLPAITATTALFSRLLR